ncbi:MAG TPA: UDP-N-acetylmuramoyl-L-alanine--D-glutamate ligase [Polyangiaceae bacterium]|nr:UDP-N-acetylmuramoyl-L-alanine--D-glutamate ligase [Polyangiaceae bacterium]
MMNLSGKTVVIVGLGESGVAAAELARKRGADVAASDSAPYDKLSADARALSDKGVRVEAGGHPANLLGRAHLVVVSPGVPPLPVLEEARRGGLEVIGELEFASRFVEAPIVAVGGTNGKSTTTALVHVMLLESGKRTFVGANFGVPLSRVAGEPFDALVLEVSSFQMERAPTFHPRVAALLNVTDDHLDRYPNFQAYAAAKGNMFVNQGVEDVAVIPKGDSVAAREARRGDARLVTFGQGADIGVDQEGRALVDRLRERRYPLSDIRLTGAHNLLNVAAAVACASEAGATEEAIARALSKFEGLAHRTAFVAEVAGVRYYDDSKGTNVGAAVAAVKGLTEERVVLIAGGRDKRGAYAPLAQELAHKGRALVLIGEAADRIAAETKGSVPHARAASMAEAVALAASLAQAGDAVLLSPACSSFDMFRDYKDRGDVFAREVRALAQASPPAGKGHA